LPQYLFENSAADALGGYLPGSLMCVLEPFRPFILALTASQRHPAEPRSRS
jgi:hypothetical protein